MSTQEFIERFNRRTGGVGIVVSFKEPVRATDLHRRSVFVRIRWREQRDGFPRFAEIDIEATLRMDVDPVNVVEIDRRTVTIATGDSSDDRTELEVPLIVDSDWDDDGPSEAMGVRLSLPHGGWSGFFGPNRVGVHRMSVVIRGDWILDLQGRALDGSHLVHNTLQSPDVPDCMGNGCQGGDWISVVHIRPYPPR